MRVCLEEALGREIATYREESVGIREARLREDGLPREAVDRHDDESIARRSSSRALLR
jgi:hypothetical protein